MKSVNNGGAADAGMDTPPDVVEVNQPDSAKVAELIGNMNKTLDGLNSRLVSPPADQVDAPPKVQVLEGQREAFMRSLLDNKPFSWTYRSNTGQLSITFRTLTVEEYDAVSGAITIVSNRTPYTNYQTVAEAHMRMSMALALTGVTKMSPDGGVVVDVEQVRLSDIDPKEFDWSDTYYVRDANGNTTQKTSTVTDSPGQRVLWLAKKRYTGLSSTMFSIYHAMYERFLAQVRAMTEETSSPDFFT